MARELGSAHACTVLLFILGDPPPQSHPALSTGLRSSCVFMPHVLVLMRPTVLVETWAICMFSAVDERPQRL